MPKATGCVESVPTVQFVLGRDLKPNMLLFDYEIGWQPILLGKIELIPEGKVILTDVIHGGQTPKDIVPDKKYLVCIVSMIVMSWSNE